MDQSFANEQLYNWSYASGSEIGSLIEEDSISNTDEELFGSLNFTQFEKETEEEIWITAPSSRITSDDESTLCWSCEELRVSSSIVQSELSQIRKEVECLCERIREQNQRRQLNKIRRVEIKKRVDHISHLLGLKPSQPQIENVTELIDANTALTWLKETRLGVYEYSNYTNDITVKKTLGIMMVFEDNENYERKCCEMLELMTDRSELAAQYIQDTPGAVELLLKILFRRLEKRNINSHDYYPFLVIANIVESEKTKKLLMKHDYLTMFINQLITNSFDRVLFFLSLILVHLLDLPDDSFPGNLSKALIERQLNKRIQLGLNAYYYAETRTSPSWCLDRIANGSEPQKHFCAFLVSCASEDSEFSKKLIEADAINTLETMISHSVIDYIVKHYIDSALEHLKEERFRLISVDFTSTFENCFVKPSASYSQFILKNNTVADLLWLD